MLQELTLTLTDYLENRISVTGCIEWLAGIDWDDPSIESDKEILGSFDLLATEVSEGIRSERELRAFADAFVNRKDASLVTPGENSSRLSRQSRTG